MNKRILICIMVIAMLVSSFSVSYGEGADYSNSEIIYGTYYGSAADNGIYFIHNTKNYTVEETHATYVTKGGEKCVSIDPMSNSVDSYGFFRVNDTFYYNGNSTLYLAIEYYDETPLEFLVEYESVENTYEKSESVKMYGTGKWMQAVIELPNAKMANGIRYDCDFRIVVKYGNKNKMYFRKISLGKSREGLNSVALAGETESDDVYNFCKASAPEIRQAI